MSLRIAINRIFCLPIVPLSIPRFCAANELRLLIPTVIEQSIINSQIYREDFPKLSHSLLTQCRNRTEHLAIVTYYPMYYPTNLSNTFDTSCKSGNVRPDLHHEFQHIFAPIMLER